MEDPNVPSHSAFASSQDSLANANGCVEEIVHIVTVSFYELPRKRLNEVFTWAQSMGEPFSISVQNSAVDEE